jgi:hypothetical protein
VKSPFVTIAFASKSNQFNMEATYYAKAAGRYSRQMSHQNRQRLESVFNNGISRMISALRPEATSTVSLTSLPFMTKAEMTQHREHVPFPTFLLDWKESLETPDLVHLYRDLLDERTASVKDSQKVTREVNRLSETEDLKLWLWRSQEDR